MRRTERPLRRREYGSADCRERRWYEAQTAASEDGTEAQAADSGQSAGETEVEPVINETVTAIEEELNSLNVQSRSDSQALVTLYNRYNALTAAEKAGISRKQRISWTRLWIRRALITTAI